VIRNGYRRGIDRSRGLVPGELCRRDYRNRRPGMGAGEVAIRCLHVLRSDCQQISAHASERNASWMCHTAHAGGETD
jgi:hypothetical protein